MRLEVFIGFGTHIWTQREDEGSFPRWRGWDQLGVYHSSGNQNKLQKWISNLRKRKKKCNPMTRHEQYLPRNCRGIEAVEKMSGEQGVWDIHVSIHVYFEPPYLDIPSYQKVTQQNSRSINQKLSQSPRCYPTNDWEGMDLELAVSKLMPGMECRRLRWFSAGG